jgi:hypothetical protein
MKILKRWHDREFTFLGGTIRLKIKALKKSEAPDFLKRMVELAEASTKLGENASVEAMFASLPLDFAAECFERYVRVAEDVQIEDEPIQTGAQLFEEADYALIMQVLRAIQGLCLFGVTEGKGSPSQSISGSDGAEIGVSTSPAQNTESAAGPSPSTVTPTPSEQLPSGLPA